MSDPSPASAVSSKASEAAGSNTQDLAARPDLADSAEVDKPFSAADAPTSQQVAEGAWWRSRFWAWTLLLLAMAGLAGALLAWQKIDHIQEELARPSLDTVQSPARTTPALRWPPTTRAAAGQSRPAG
jgi:hypothetical protein